MRATNAKAIDFFVAFAVRGIELPRVKPDAAPVKLFVRLSGPAAAPSRHGAARAAGKPCFRQAAASDASPLAAARHAAAACPPQYV